MKKIVMLSAMMLLASGCATYTDTAKLKMEALTQHYSQFDVRMAWDTRAAGDKSYVEGVVQNVRYLAMYDLQITVEAFDAAGKRMGRGTAFVIPSQLGRDERAEFSVKLPVPVQPGNRLRFTYSYRGSDGGDDEEGFPGLERGTFWTQSFDAVVPRR